MKIHKIGRLKLSNIVKIPAKNVENILKSRQNKLDATMKEIDRLSAQITQLDHSMKTQMNEYDEVIRSHPNPQELDDSYYEYTPTFVVGIDENGNVLYEKPKNCNN